MSTTRIGWIATIIGALALAAGPGTAAPPNNRAALQQLADQYVSPVLKANNVTSAMVAVSIKGQRYYFPYSQMGGMTPTPTTRVEIGSITKVFTGTLLGQALSTGEINVDQSIGAYLPGTTLTECAAKISAVRLADFSSGLPLLPVPANQRQPITVYTPAMFLAWLSTQDPPSSPCNVGAGYIYSNASVGLLGPILANVNAAKASWETLVASRIATPLGLSATTISPQGQIQGYTAAGQPAPVWPLFAWYAAGALRSNAQDMLSFGEAALGHPTVNGLTVPPILRQAFQVAQRGRYNRPNGDQVGLSWESRRDTRGQWMTYKNGGTSGFNSVIVVNPAVDCAVFVVINKNIAGTAGTDITAAGLAMMNAIDS